MMKKNFDPTTFEQYLYKRWCEKGYFTPKPDPDKKPFTIVIPPPNITGQLHMGHALNNTLQDVIIRYKRMDGYAALWLPGTDHASIATELKIVEQIQSEGQTKQSIGREAFLKRAYAWKEKFGGRIVESLGLKTAFTTISASVCALTLVILLSYTIYKRNVSKRG